MAGPDIDFWQARFDSGTTPWDRGASNPRLGRWIESGGLEPCRILVPGCGSGYEVAALAAAGFEVTGVDYAPSAVRRARARISALALPQGASAQVIQADALRWSAEAPFDAVYEQTFLCALYPDSWVPYAAQLNRWLRPGGRLFALFMQAPRPGPPRGASRGRPTTATSMRCAPCSRRIAGTGPSRLTRRSSIRRGSPSWRWNWYAAEGRDIRPAAAAHRPRPDSARGRRAQPSHGDGPEEFVRPSSKEALHFGSVARSCGRRRPGADCPPRKL